ncbi:uncharacterized protein HMPREF1541_07239 [Cyphellophora europaea CBS 101466]|uniref:Protein kinase domain-containing protein n=1 Tax=Cyphellophora europaea (strain CBS 101466) TaxID=1220924 RepID=W2RMA6_CYPE1|nr:uncharacterized protein HMPREF1541_07239 [Cyphellophora europaea CBS 101466]ETN37617.1 hypothetical protein HMPREF1541_07239 [Cyphellophora europaea CBS 101466]
MPSTRSSDPKPPKTHILDFFYDDEEGIAFTARINDQRFHISVDAGDLKTDSGDEGATLNEYRHLLQRVKGKDEVENEGVEKAGDGGWPTKRSGDRDSGIDVNADSEGASSKENEPNLAIEDSDAALELQNWILKDFGDEVPQQREACDSATQDRSIQDWYDTSIAYYKLQPSSSESSVEPVPIEETPILRKRVEGLQPHVPIPKKLRSLPIPWIQASDVTVLAETDEPPPIHPSLVRASIDGSDPNTYFFKPVDPTQPQPANREIELLHKVHSLDLHQHFRVPYIHAFVGFRTSKTDIVGYLLTTIDEAVPLTKLLDSEVDESKREKWAQETKKIVKTLHKHGIIWGDAKADNFLVDRDDALWVIDFGGSYTEGWVDEELLETKEGDDMGLEKIVNGLKDPDGMTVDWNEQERGESSGGKRKREDEANGEDGEDVKRLRPRAS